MLRFARAVLLLILLSPPARAFYDFDPDWTETGVVGDGWGDAATTVGDVNGDGYSDIAVGSPQYGDDPLWSKGKVSVYYGSPTGPSSTPDWEWFQNIPFQQLGATIAPAGDMNGDGYADFVVGAPYYSSGQSQEGRLYFFMGSPDGPYFQTTAEVNDEDALLGYSVAYAGDVNGDGYDDVIAGAPGWGGFGSPFYIVEQGRAYIYYGGPDGPDHLADWNVGGGDEDGQFGWSVAGLGDVNGDGFSDVIVGKPQFDTGLFNNDRGAVYAYYGSASGPSTSSDWDHIGTHDGDELGRELAFAGDWTGDGFADAIFGVPDYLNGNGAVFIATGGWNGLGGAVILTSGFSSNWGGTLAGIGDFNGDGLSDMVVGGGTDDDAYVYFGNFLSGYEERILGSGQFASLVASAGDCNGDGFGDFLVTDPIEALGAGSIRIYFGGREIDYALGISFILEGETNSDEKLGSAVAAAGDVNGDGLGDLLLGARERNGVGQAHLYFGTPSGIPLSPDWSVEGDGPEAGRFGHAVAGAGDVNGDGYDDIVVTDLDLQQVKVFHGSPSGPSLVEDWSYVFTEGAEEFGAAVTGGGDINGDGYADIAVGIPGYGFDNGLVRVFFGSSTGIQSTGYIDKSSSGTTHRLGHSLAIVGDGNADGFDDLVVGAPGVDSRAVIYYGDEQGFKGFSSIKLGVSGDSQMGASVAAAGDVNGDGFADFICGEPYADVNSTDDGQAHIYFGSATLFDSSVSFNAGNSGPDLHFGARVCGIGDISRSGKSAVAVRHTEPGGGGVIVRIYEQYLTAMPPRSSMELIYSDEDAAIAGIGDFHGNGEPQLAVGLPNAEFGNGEVIVSDPPGARGFLYPPAEPRMTTTGGDPIALRGIAHQTDDLRFHMTGWLPVGRTRVSLEWNCGEERQPLAHLGQGAWTPSTDPMFGTPLTVDPSVALSSGTRYRWRIRVRSTNPFSPFGPWLSVQPNTDTLYAFRRLDTVTAVEESTPSVSSSLAGAFPNPFNPRTQIEFTLVAKQSVELDIYDMKGRLVRALHRGDLEAGVHRLAWNGDDDAGSGVASGVYLAVMRAGGDRHSMKLSLMK